LEKCKDVTFPFSSQTQQTHIEECISDMKNTVLNVEGYFYKNALAIAANQVGYNYKMILILNPKYKKHFNRLKDHLLIINPNYTEITKKTNIKWEGCLSNPE